MYIDVFVSDELSDFFYKQVSRTLVIHYTTVIYARILSSGLHIDI